MVLFWYYLQVFAHSPGIDRMPSLAKSVGPLDALSSLPLYQQLQRALRLAIDQHILAPDDTPLCLLSGTNSSRPNNPNHFVSLE